MVIRVCTVATTPLLQVVTIKAMPVRMAVTPRVIVSVRAAEPQVNIIVPAVVCIDAMLIDSRTVPIVPVIVQLVVFVHPVNGLLRVALFFSVTRLVRVGIQFVR